MTDKVELLKRLDPEHYFEEFLSEGVYPDGRQLTQFRDAIIDCGGSTGGYQGSAYVQQGGAYVSCSVQLSLAPDSDDPLVQFEMEAMNSVPKYLLEHAHAHLQTIFAENRLIQPDILRVNAQCIASGSDHHKKATTKIFDLRWTIHLKIKILSWDGFILDSILVAVQAALLDTRLPTRVEYADLGAAGSLFADDDDFNLLGEEVPLQFDIEKISIVEPKRHNKPLELKQTLVYVPFLLYKSAECKDNDDRLILSDPPADLCKLFGTNRCEIIIGPESKMHSCSFSTANPGIMSQSLLEQMVSVAEQRHYSVTNALKECARKQRND